MFEYDAGTGSWRRRGQPIRGTQNRSRIGMSLSLSPDGMQVAYSVSDSARHSSRVVAQEWNGREWVALGQELLPERPGDMFGSSISLMNNGPAVGAVSNGFARLVRLVGGGLESGVAS